MSYVYSLEHVFRFQILFIGVSVSLCKIGMSIVGGDGDSSLAYGGWYKQNLFGDYRIHSYDVRGNRIFINDQRFFLSKNINDIWMVSN